MKKFLAVLLPIILIGSLASSIFVSASPCDPALWRPSTGWTQAGQHNLANTATTPAGNFPGFDGQSGWFEVRPVTHNWNEDGTVLLSRVVHPRGMVGGAVNIRSVYIPGGRALEAEYGNVISQIPVWFGGEMNYVWATGEFFMAGTTPCWGFWVVVYATDIFGVERHGVMHNQHLLNPETGAVWIPGVGAVQLGV